MKQFLICAAVILSVGAVLLLNGLVDNVQEVNSYVPEEAAETPAEPVLMPADLEALADGRDSAELTDAEVLPADLEYVFDAKFEEDGHIVEIYREFEIYRDAEGNVIKEVPTSNFEYIKYQE
ncbi:hypothetical protein D3H55_16640 [Bacillus salacetis]|uniref:Uncharacterized protein n=1 Tax=Bacillus salacetis TaxID=2315464 RepID=A0A3A1QSK9_9BACI|nr:hypothetical protein [Bacillus salacetis]RIW30366.1 hypothetical protein D3H55_16640 [Bacillus salacetis]